ncbi:MAG TPA: AMP-binding protein [Usitatibacteraceae bacterium]|nr:AMP-binding protein [Usitatibacteraceae bacterium]
MAHDQPDPIGGMTKEEHVNPAADAPWLQSYPSGIAHTIDPDRYPSINAIVDEACKTFADRPAFTCLDKTLSFREVDTRATQLAAYLSGVLRLSRGDRVAIMMPNLLQYPIAVFGILRAGLVVVNCNPLYTPRELEHQLKDSGAKAIVVVENCASTLEQVIARTDVRHVVTTQVGDLLGFPKSLLVNFVIKHRKKLVPTWSLPGAVSFRAALASGSAAPFSPPQMRGDELAFLQYTGGTTGVSKGAMLTHRNLAANMEQIDAWMNNLFERGKDVIVQPLPLYHIFALCSGLVFTRTGMETVLIPNPRDFDGFVQVLASRRWNALTGVNTLFASLLNHPRFAGVDFSGVKLVLSGGMALQKAVAERWKSVTGVTVMEGYGLTETSPAACITPVTTGERLEGIGLPIPSTVLTIRDDDENILPVGQSGEICISGPQVMRGYWQRPDETAKVMTRDGAFKSGDVGVMDERGYFKIVDRKKDMILVSGFNVYPNEIEDVVATCPGVREVCAVAAPDEKSGEVVRVVVVKGDPALTREKVMEHCKANLTGYKLPKIIEFWDDLPKTNVGKILRRTVRDTPPKG